MARRPPQLSPAGVIRLVRSLFPFKSIEEESVKELVSYDDRNYYFRASLGITVPNYPSKQTTHITSSQEFVLKVLNRRDSKEIDTVEMLTEIKKFLYTKGLNVPFPIPSLQGSEIITLTEASLYKYIDKDEKSSNGELLSVNEDHHHQIRVLTFIPGQMFSDVEQTPLLMFKLGHYLATMHDNLKSFSHSGAIKRQFLEWDLKYLHTLHHLIPKGIKDPTKLKMITKIVDNFENHVTPVIPQLPHSVIHGDFNDMNIIINKESMDINGVIDFSDCVYTPVVFDLAIALAYAMLEKSDPVKSVSPILSGYCSVRKLSEQEFDLLYYIVLGRLAQSCINGEYSYQLEPSNEYLLVSVKPAWLVIKHVLGISKNDCDKIWHNATLKTQSDYIY